MQVTLNRVLREKAPRFVHLVKGLINLKPQLGGKFERGVLCDLPPDFVPVFAQPGQRLFPPVPAKRQDERRRDLQVRGCAHFAHRDGHPVEVGIMHIATGQHLRQGAADQFADAQLPLRRAGAIVKTVLCHGGDISLFARSRKLGLCQWRICS